MKSKQILLTLTVILLLAVFFFTSMEKIVHHKSFVIALNKQPLPNWMIAMLEWSLPIIELIVVGLLVIRRTRLPALWASALLMFIFTAYTVYAASEPYGYVPCACGKLFESLSWAQHAVINLLLTGLAVVGIRWHKEIKNNEAESTKSKAQQHIIAQLPD